jgi:5-formyltetrahydrofolate cyclo-ligase
MLAQCRHFNHLVGTAHMAEFDRPGDGTGAAVADAKREQRVRLLADRRSLAAADRDRQDAAIRDAAIEWLAGRRDGVSRTVAGHVPMPGEPGGAGLPAALRVGADRLLLPVLRPDRDLDWAVYEGDNTLVPGRLGLREPAGPRLGPAAIAEAAVIVVPAVAVDRLGGRLGRGGGSYDRALARARPETVVLAALYRGELVDHVPCAAHDQPVDGAIVDGQVIVW